MFKGKFEHVIDPKGRTSIPSKFREILTSNYDERLIITNYDGCLWAYPYAEWKIIEEKISKLPQFKPEVKALQRVFISGATECPFDSQGRILIPPALRAYAGLVKDIVVIGMTRRIEIWDRQRWEDAFQKAQQQIDSIAETLADLGL